MMILYLLHMCWFENLIRIYKDSDKRGCTLVKSQFFILSTSLYLCVARLLVIVV